MGGGELCAAEAAPRAAYEAFLAALFPNPHVRSFVRAWLARLLVGGNAEGKFYFFVGAGAPLFLTVLRKVLGENCASVPVGAFKAKRNPHLVLPGVIAALGKRVVASQCRGDEAEITPSRVHSWVSEAPFLQESPKRPPKAIEVLARPAIFCDRMPEIRPATPLVSARVVIIPVAEIAAFRSPSGLSRIELDTETGGTGGAKTLVAPLAEDMLCEMIKDYPEAARKFEPPEVIKELAHDYWMSLRRH